MSEHMTSITSPRAPGLGSGLENYGRQSRAKMIADIRQSAKRDLKRAQAILDTPYDEFVVAQYRGAYARKDLIIIEPGSEK